MLVCGCGVLRMVMEHTILFSLTKQESLPCFLTPLHNVNQSTRGGVSPGDSLKNPTVPNSGEQCTSHPIVLTSMNFSSWFWNPHKLLTFCAKVFHESDRHSMKKHLCLYVLNLLPISCITIITIFMYPVLALDD